MLRQRLLRNENQALAAQLSAVQQRNASKHAARIQLLESQVCPACLLGCFLVRLLFLGLLIVRLLVLTTLTVIVLSPPQHTHTQKDGMVHCCFGCSLRSKSSKVPH
jgi:hypothetical protein